MKGAVPPAAFTVAVPLLLPEQDAGEAVAVAVMTGNGLMVAAAVAVQPLASVIRQE